MSTRRNRPEAFNLASCLIGSGACPRHISFAVEHGGSLLLSAISLEDNDLTILREQAVELLNVVDAAIAEKGE